MSYRRSRLVRALQVAVVASGCLLAFAGGIPPVGDRAFTGLLIVGVGVLMFAFLTSRRRPASVAVNAAEPQKPRNRPSRTARGEQPEIAAALVLCRSTFIAVGVFSGVINILMLSGSLYMLEIYDRVLPSRSVPTLIGISILVIVLYGGQGLLDFIRGRILVRLGAAVTEAMGPRLHASVLKLPQKVGHINDGLQPMRDLDNIRTFLGGSGPGALFDLPWLPLYLVVIFAFHFLLGITALVGAIVLVVLTLVAERLTHAPVKAATKASNARSNLVDGGYRNAEVVAAMGMTGRLTQRWARLNADYLAEHRKVSDVAGGFGAISRVLRLMLQSSMLGIGAWLVIEQEATAGIIIAASILSGRALAPVDMAIANWKGFSSARQGWQRLMRVLAVVQAESSRTPLPAPCRSVEMQGVTVCAPSSQQRLLVHDANFAVEARHAVAIIGPSGSGKSSLVRALVGAWHPISGRVRLDGADLDQWSEDDRGRYVGYLPQDIELFAGTVAENIARFDEDADPALVVEAAKAAGAHDMIVGFRDGYETQVGEQGESVSAGQRQRIALARALYGNPFLIVLDEPNSNLDSEGEQALNRAILAVRERGGIVVVVAHRPSVLITVDFVLAMNEGRVHAFGPKDDVLAKLFPRPQPNVAAQGQHLRLAAEQTHKAVTDAAAKGQ